MNNQHNALGLFGPSESALLALALKYELVTGQQVKWRKSELAIFEMVKNALSSDNADLFRKTTEFMDSLPADARKKLSAFGIECTPAAQVSPQKYRGAVVSESPSKEQNVKQKQMWRGTAYN